MEGSTLTAKKFIGEGAVVTGMIVMWSGKKDEIPAGWALCDGSNGTPDLRDRFILGSGDIFQSLTDNGRFGGQSSHTHTMSEAGKHAHGAHHTGQRGHMALNPDGGDTDLNDEPSHTHAIGAASVLPPYYKMAFIIKL
jgi:hypothetical protein